VRLVKQGDQYTGYFKTPQSSEWVQVGPTTISLTPPLEVGIYAGVDTWSGNMRVDYAFFRVNSDSSGELISDDFSGPSSLSLEAGPLSASMEESDSLNPSSRRRAGQGGLTRGPKQSWHWSRKPKEWSLTRSGLHLQADVNSSLYREDSVAKLYQTTGADAFDIETQFAANWQIHEPWLTLRVIPLAFPFILMLIPIFHPSRNRYDFLFLAFFLLCLLLYFLFYFDGSTWGITPVNARYYTECTLLGIIPLVARGMFIFYGWVRRIPSKLPVALIGLLLILLTANTVYTYVLIGGPYRNWGPVYQKLPQLVKQENIHHAVIFVPRRRGAPIGDYPFQSLQDADIVYFKLGPSKIWRLTNSDWYSVYEQYFKGRDAYIYESGQLMPLLVGQ
jgi:hypothetical protein